MGTCWDSVTLKLSHSRLPALKASSVEDECHVFTGETG